MYLLELLILPLFYHLVSVSHGLIKIGKHLFDAYRFDGDPVYNIFPVVNFPADILLASIGRSANRLGLSHVWNRVCGVLLLGTPL
jgi:hypothetical protein